MIMRKSVKEKYHELTKSGVFSQKQKLNVRGVQKSISKISGYKICSQKNACVEYNPKHPDGTSKKRHQSGYPAAKLFEHIRTLSPEQRVELISNISEMYKN